MTPPARWLRFNLVGVAGFAVQLLTLAALERWSTAPASVAVTVAVLAAVSHNFLWHERVTWPGQPREGRWWRWLSFNVSTGVVSVLTNLIVTSIVTAAIGAPLLASNAIAVVSASLVNFWVSDRLLFTSGPRVGAAPPRIGHYGHRRYFAPFRSNMLRHEGQSPYLPSRSSAAGRCHRHVIATLAERPDPGAGAALARTVLRLPDGGGS